MREKTLPRYREYNDVNSYLELHQNYTMWELNNDKLSDEDYNLLVEDAVRVFEDETGVKLYGLGRMGRHICVEDTPENSRKYQYLKKKALGLEKWVIDTFNNMKEDFTEGYM